MQIWLPASGFPSRARLSRAQICLANLCLSLAFKILLSLRDLSHGSMEQSSLATGPNASPFLAHFAALACSQRANYTGRAPPLASGRAQVHSPGHRSRPAQKNRASDATSGRFVAWATGELFGGIRPRSRGLASTRAEQLQEAF